MNIFNFKIKNNLRLYNILNYQLVIIIFLIILIGSTFYSNIRAQNFPFHRDNNAHTVISDEDPCGGPVTLTVRKKP